MEFGHPMDSDGHVTCGDTGLMWEDILDVRPVSAAELKQWRIMTLKFISKIIDKDGSYPCFENVMNARAYESV